YSEGMLDKQELEPRLRAAKDRLLKLESEAQTLAAQQAQQAELRLALTRLQDFADQVKAGLEQADWPTRREVIRAVVKRIEINDQEVRIVYRVAPVPFVKRPGGGALQDCPKGQEPFRPGSFTAPGLVPGAEKDPDPFLDGLPVYGDGLHVRQWLWV